MLSIHNNRLEATFGVIAAAAPSIRPLLGRNPRSADYTSAKSRARSHSLPLHSMRIGKISRFGRRDVTLGPRDDPVETESEGDGDSQSHLWAEQDGRNIMKTTSVEIVTTQGDVDSQLNNGRI